MWLASRCRQLTAQSAALCWEGRSESPQAQSLEQCKPLAQGASGSVFMCAPREFQLHLIGLANVFACLAGTHLREGPCVELRRLPLWLFTSWQGRVTFSRVHSVGVTFTHDLCSSRSCVTITSLTNTRTFFRCSARGRKLLHNIAFNILAAGVTFGSGLSHCTSTAAEIT